MKKAVYLILLSLIGLGCGERTTVSVENLTCEMLVNPISIDNVNPHFSWILSSERNGAASTAYQILVASRPEWLNENDADLWNSGIVESPESVSVTYGGKELASPSLAYWKVRIRDHKGRLSQWSETGFFGIGLLSEDDWDESAGFIGALQDDPDSETAPLLRKSFKAKTGEGRYLLHVNSLGYHEAYINGEPVSDAVLNPAVSQFGVRSRIMTYDVSPLVKEGDNEVVLWTGKGWYQTHSKAVVPGGPYVRAQLEHHGNSGVVTITATDSSWLYSESDRRTFGTWLPHKMGGEIVDSRRSLANLKPETLDKLDWHAVVLADIPEHKASPQMCEANRIVEKINPIAVHKVGEDSYIYDMGSCFVGFTEIKMPVVADGKLIELYYEDFYLNDLNDFRDGEYCDYYIGNGCTAGRFSSKFNYKGYRYLKIKGLSEPLPLSDITGGKVRTGYKADASFECSDEDINAIYDMIHNTCHALTLGGYMVDCPQIERLGYGGDGNASTATLQTIANAAPLYMNWIQAWSDCQRENGDIPHTAPNPYSAGGGPFWCTFIIPASWHTYVNYGDRRLIERYYPNMQKWIGFAERHCVDGLLKNWGNTDYRNWYLGDWAVPRGVIDQQDESSVELISNCVLSQAYDIMSKIAAVLGLAEDSEMYAEKHMNQNKLIHRTFYNEKEYGYASMSQTDIIYPMLVGATPECCIPDVEVSLRWITEDRFKGQFCTGLVGIPVISQWATREGKADFIYSILKKRGYPGYLNMIDNGATLTWELWESDRSQIHNCFNGIGTWFYQALAGIVPDEEKPGYRHMFIRPQMVEGIDWVKAHKDTPYGKVSVSWERKRKSFSMTVSIPTGATATIILPDGRVRELGSGTHEL